MEKNILQIINIILALLAIPPSLELLKIVIKEKDIISPKEKIINRILAYLFLGISIGSLINAVISINLLIGNEVISYKITPIGNLFTNLFFSSVSWLLYNFHKKLKKG